MALNFIHSYREFLSSNSLLNLIYFLFFPLHHPCLVFAHLAFDLRSLCLVSLFCEIPILSLTNPPINLSLEKNCFVLGTPLFKRKKNVPTFLFTNSTFVRLVFKALHRSSLHLLFSVGVLLFEHLFYLRLTHCLLKMYFFFLQRK